VAYIVGGRMWVRHVASTICSWLIGPAASAVENNDNGNGDRANGSVTAPLDSWTKLSSDDAASKLGVPLAHDPRLLVSRPAPLLRLELATREVSGSGWWDVYHVPEGVARLLTERKWTRDPPRAGAPELVDLTPLDAGVFDCALENAARVVECVCCYADDGTTDVRNIFDALFGTSDTAVVAPFLGWPKSAPVDYQVGFYHWAAKAPEPCWLLFTFQGCTD
jgi:hypothetical protein